MIKPALTKASRVMLIAPHPDDESLAAGVFLQRAVAASAQVRVIYVTDGDDNPWPQRILEKRWRLNASDRARWGKRRRREAIEALKVLGLDATNARFLGLPDQRLTDALLHECDGLSKRMARMIVEWNPTHLLCPSELDTHPDHSAVALLIRFALDRVPANTTFALLNYLVHGRRTLFQRLAVDLRQNARETAIKRRAIAQHLTQVKFSRRRFMAYAKRPEYFLNASAQPGVAAGGTVRGAFRTLEQLRLVLRFRMKPLSKQRPTLYLVGRSRANSPLTLKMQLPSHAAHIQITDCVTTNRIGVADYRGTPSQGLLTFPVELFAPDRPVFAKISRRRWCFDEAGWMVIAPLASCWLPIASAAIDQLADQLALF